MNTTVPSTRRMLHAGGRPLGYFHDLAVLQEQGWGNIGRLPFSLRILLESLLRHDDGGQEMAQSIRQLAGWRPRETQRPDIPFTVARILAPDASGIPLLADLAAMRDAACAQGAAPGAIEPLLPVDMVVDHSLQVERAGSSYALAYNTRMEFERNGERYSFLKWAAGAFDGIRVVAPGNGIIHQVNIEFLAHHVCQDGGLLYPDTVIGPDSHTAMINGLGVLGWGVGGIEAEAAMLGQPLALAIPDVVGVELLGRLQPGVMATDLALSVTELLRRSGVVGKFVEFYGEGAAGLSPADRCTVANMAPEYGATAAFFAVDAQTMDFLRATGRTQEQLERICAYWQAQGMYGMPRRGQIDYSQDIRIDLAQIEPSASGPRRPQDRVGLAELDSQFTRLLALPADQGGFGRGAPARGDAPAARGDNAAALSDGDIVIAAITSCANTSNPALLLAAGLLARNAAAHGLRCAAHVKTSFTPGSKVVQSYLRQTGLLQSLEQLGFHIAGFGCGTCMGNSGPLPADVEAAIGARDLVVASVLSGNRNFEARIHPSIRANYLMSPAMVVAFALAGRITDIQRAPLGLDARGQPVFLRDLWPSAADVQALLPQARDTAHFLDSYSEAAMDNPLWSALPAPQGKRFAWDPDSTYLRRPPFLDGVQAEPAPLAPVAGARALALLGDSVTTDHISPGGSIHPDSPAGQYLLRHGVAAAEFNTYVARRANHEVMVRGTFANVRLRNRMVAGIEGGVTRMQPGGNILPIHEAARVYQAQAVPLLVFAGKEYGTGSSRDWAAKGTRLLGVRAVIARSFERIHRSNLVGMGVLPCEFLDGQDIDSLGLDGTEAYSLPGIENGVEPRQILPLRIHRQDGSITDARVLLRVDTRLEASYIRHGGVLPYVLRKQLAKPPAQASQA
ncbi:aconitate hydratase AcnA [Pollutimonas bauzanensis]|uniref:Aconitate hydratase n=1 Tax=Pollutimonas bauzanensis TaxID=658167 RepID=A0A1M5TDS8_9BURK|nr:aconitate hydratase AcnA [Pollutimonas bauzanensis]SHH48864.1 aconitate hydratase [Pollutimonas bauzanensis]